jgi:peptidoglycan/LPS O-acetylase OafA/YrhL
VSAQACADPRMRMQRRKITQGDRSTYTKSASHRRVRRGKMHQIFASVRQVQATAAPKRSSSVDAPVLLEYAKATIPAPMKIAAPHFQRIDTLRGVAIAMVFLFHFLLAVHQRNGDLAAAAAVPDPLKPLLHIYVLGILGVPLFFVISGFCIQSSYLSWRAKQPTRRTRDYLPHFFQRRFYRIFPPYLIALLTLYVIKTPEPFAWEELKKLAAHLLLVNTLVPDLFFHLNSSFWSICVEWQLYLLFPVFLWLTLRIGPWWSLVVSAAATLFFQVYLARIGAPPYITNLPFRWWFDWALGAYLAVAFARQQRIFPAHWLVPVALGAATYAVMIWGPSAELKRIVPPFFFASLVECAIWSTRRVSRIEKWVGNLGQCSYTFYLWHQPATYLIVGLVAAQFAQTGPLTIWLGLCGAIFALLWVCSWFGYLTLEKPSVRLGEWVMKKGWKAPKTSTPDTVPVAPQPALTVPTQPAV